MISESSYTQFSELMESKGVTSLYMKYLAENDNRKNQIYLGGDFSSIQIIPHREIHTDDTAARPNFKAKVDFFWLDNNGTINLAPAAQLILYPDYPEVRFSGFLRGAQNPPSALMASREPGRVLFFGVCEDGRIIGYVTTRETQLAREIMELGELERVGVFLSLPMQIAVESKTILLRELKRIHRLGWLDSKRLTSQGYFPCLGQNCGGLTLEAELGIVSNSRSEPDFMGYEVKQFSVKDLDRVNTGTAITLMTPEPQGGIYRDQGGDAFIRRFGHVNTKTADRIDFSGTHYIDTRHPITGLTLRLSGFDTENNEITNVNGAIELTTDDGIVAASWRFTDIIAHWSRKHAHAVYVPSNKRDAPALQYRYGHIVLLGEKTDALFLLKAFALGQVYYDPGIHLDNISAHPTRKKRNQFRIRPRNLGFLYETLTPSDVLAY